MVRLVTRGHDHNRGRGHLVDEEQFYPGPVLVAAEGGDGDLEVEPLGNAELPAQQLRAGGVRLGGPHSTGVVIH